MKKITSLSCIALLLFFVSSCRKTVNNEVQKKNFGQNKNNSYRLASTDLNNAVGVSSYGFLVFDSTALSLFSEFLKDNDTNDIHEFVGQKGIVPQIETFEHADNSIEPSIENCEFFFNKDGIVQIGDILIRGVNNDGYVLVLPVEYNSPENYQKLSSKTFDPSIMAKLLVSRDYAPSMSEFVRSNIGYNGTTTDSLPPIQAKFWGWGEWHRTGGVACHRHYYMFGITVGRQYGYCP
ncbi:MAG: hypothetical protein JST21_19055 [Bacteroidetes bacterium]|nr:hypothetical protein [Bacteroidota bacterium]